MNEEQRSKSYNLVTPQDKSTAGEVHPNSSMYVEVGPKYHGGKVIIIAHLGNTYTAVCNLLEATDITGSGHAAVSGKTVTLTGTTAVPEQIGEIEFKVGDLTDGSNFVGVSITTDNNGDDVGAVLLLTDARTYRSTMP